MQHNWPMHLLISHAAPPGPLCQATVPQLALPHLTELLGLLSVSQRLDGSPQDLTPLPERIRASHQGLQGADGLIPWAARDANHLGLTKTHGAEGWAWITPCHLTPQSNQVQMDDPRLLQLEAHECETLRLAMKPFFEEDGITLFPLGNGTWLAQGEVFRGLPTASLERVSSTGIDPWMPQQESARGLRRLQNEMQMLLYTHAVNDARSARGLPTVNAFWISATGTPEATTMTTTTTTTEPASGELESLDSLRQAALSDDPYAWQTAWEALDGTRLADLVQRARRAQPVQLTLCGPNAATTLALQHKPWWDRLQQRFTAASAGQLLQGL
jgi:hypothetical protein